MRILLAMGDSRTASFLRKGLREESYRVKVAGEGSAVLAAARAADYDLLILDSELPGPSGMSVLAELYRRCNLPVLMLAAGDRVEERVAALNAGCDDCLAKPFAFAELLARVRAILRRKRPGKPVVLRAGDLVMDPITHHVSRAGRPIALSGREYALLRCFLQNPNRVLARALIAACVWGDDLDSASNVVDVYVNYLRSKVDRDFEPKLIHTVRGAGYVLRAME